LTLENGNIIAKNQEHGGTEEQNQSIIFSIQILGGISPTQYTITDDTTSMEYEIV
jgi:hypothetical protein